MATYSQHHMDGLELHLTPLHYFQKCFLDEKDEKLRAHLSNFGIAGELALQPMYTLSGGQKGRVAFAKVRPPERTSVPAKLVQDPRAAALYYSMRGAENE